MRCRTNIAPGIDVRGDGGYIVAPPSLHASGNRYQWVETHHPDRTPLPPLPTWLVSEEGDPAAEDEAPVGQRIHEGTRNSTLAEPVSAMLRTSKPGD